MWRYHFMILRERQQNIWFKRMDEQFQKIHQSIRGGMMLIKVKAQIIAIEW